ncbi:PAS domain-containing protein [Rhodovibrionaceae bacterium A322]
MLDLRAEEISVRCEMTIRSLADAEELLDDPRLLDLYRYWLEKKGARPGPARGDLDPPYELTRFLPYLFLLRRQEAVCDGQVPEFRYSLVGTNSVSVLGFDNTGQSLNCCQPPSVRTAFEETLLSLIQDPAPHYSKGCCVKSERELHWFKRLMVPLCDEEGTVTHFLGAIYFVEDRTLSTPFCGCLSTEDQARWLVG